MNGVFSLKSNKVTSGAQEKCQMHALHKIRKKLICEHTAESVESM